MNLSGRATETSICITTNKAQFHFMEEDNGDVAMHIYDKQLPRFECASDRPEDGESWSGQIWTDEFTRSEHILVLFLDCVREKNDELVSKYVLVSMPGHNPYGISSPGTCSDIDGKTVFTQEEVLKEMKKRRYVPCDNMRCDVVPGKCGWYRWHMEDCEEVEKGMTK